MTFDLLSLYGRQVLEELGEPKAMTDAHPTK